MVHNVHLNSAVYVRSLASFGELQPLLLAANGHLALHPAAVPADHKLHSRPSDRKFSHKTELDEIIRLVD